MDVETSQLCEIVPEVQRGGRPEGSMGIPPTHTGCLWRVKKENPQADVNGGSPQCPPPVAQLTQVTYGKSPSPPGDGTTG